MTAMALVSMVSRELILQHPLQRLASPSRGLSAVLHTIGIISFSLSYKYLVDFPTMINDSYGWHWQYLTILGMTLAYATFIFGLLADISLSPKLFLVKNTLALCSAPLEVLISILYWGIVAIDKRLLVPPGIQISPIADIGFHAMPSFLLIIDILFLSPPWEIRALQTIGLSGTIALAYWVWVDHCFKHNGFYPYPLFAQLNTTQMVILFTAAAALMTGCTVMLKWLYSRVNRGTGRRATQQAKQN